MRRVLLFALVFGLVMACVSCTAAARGSGSDGTGPITGALKVTTQTTTLSTALASGPFSDGDVTNSTFLVMVTTTGSSGAVQRVKTAGITSTGSGCSTSTLGWQRVARANAQPGTAEIWAGRNTGGGSVGGSVPCRVTASWVQSTHGQISVYLVHGTTGTPVGAEASGLGQPKVNVTTAAGDLAVAAGEDWSGAQAKTPLTGQSLIQQTLAASDDTWWSQRVDSHAPGTYPVGVAAVNRRYNLVGAVLHPKAPTDPSSPPTDPPSTPPATGWPDADSTGPVLAECPNGLTPSGALAITTPNTVVECKAITGNVEIFADHVTIRNVRITCSGDCTGDWAIGLRHGADAATITQVEISGPSGYNPLTESGGSDRLEVGVKSVYGDTTGTTVTRSEVRHVSTGLQFDCGLIQDNYLHDFGYRSGDHTNGTTSGGAGTGDCLLDIHHNTIMNQIGQTDAISLFEDFGYQANRQIRDNLVGGGAYTIYAGQNAGGPETRDIDVVGNHFVQDIPFEGGTVRFDQYGYYGPLTAMDVTDPGNSCTGNVDHTTGALVGASEGCS